MAEYIERIELIEEMKRNSLKMFNSYYKGYVEAIKDVADFKKADVQPVRRGKWENTNTPNQLRCSRCDIIHFIAQYPHGEINYCPNCGADMRNKED